MKLKQPQTNSKHGPAFGRRDDLRRGKRPGIFGRSRQRHDPMLVLNMALFNFTDGWNRAFSREQYARFSV
ncbi:MAG TPA: hypothetical protein VFU09_10410 [Candidatus Udaeobacter sp.]|nr:hypothetical protein [Candidatus Udaeobacter sp.]